MEIDKEELKNEAKNTVNQVKDTIKNVDINKEAKETKGFLKGMLVEPFETVERVAKGEEEVFKRAVVLVIIYMAASFISSLLGYSYGGIVYKLKNLVVATIKPVIAVLVPTILIILMNKNNKKSATTIISTIVVSIVPSIVASVICILNVLLSRIGIITNPIASALGVISTVLTFFGMKTLFAEEKGSFLPKFALIEFITALALYII